MSENIRIVDGINVTSTDVRCPGCGATIGVKFDPATATLHCPFCGLSSQLPAPEENDADKELDFNSALQRANVNWGRLKKLVVCSSCGGQTLYDAEQITGACPFCGSTSVAPAAENAQIMAPNVIIPFSVSKEQAHQLFRNYMNRKHCVTKKVRASELENLVGIYLPFWTYDAYTVSTFVANQGSRGYEAKKYYKGVWNHYFDDITVFASNKFRHPLLSKVHKFDFEKAVPYSPEYLAGIPAERYTLGLNTCWSIAKMEMEPVLRKEIEKNYEHIMVSWIKSNYYNVRFRCLLAPVYFGSFKHGKKTYPVAINGQTGQAFFDVPTYILKLILICIAAGIIILAAFILYMYLFPDSPLFWFFRMMG
ncbi:MAG: hypothetical protein K5875_04195 [Saccharofermentans sp.]|nr:hypothetical protein [Saccharofermentans sp.]